MSVIKPENIKERIETEEDFINSKKHGYSLQHFLDASPSGTTDNIIAYFLKIKVSDVKDLYESAIRKIRQKLKIEVD
jgi:c-di-GMP-related signal transduction protein